MRNRDLSTAEKIFSRSGVNIMTLITIVFAAGMFYSQNISYHSTTEERFAAFTKQKDEQTDQMNKLASSLSQTTVQLSALTERLNAQTDVIKDIRELLRGKTLK